MKRICVFDVNETLLDLSALDSHFERVFGDAAVRREWFAQMLQSAFVSTITGPYRQFGEIGASALDMIATRRRVSLAAEERNKILQGMRHLPAHPDVTEGLTMLRQAGFRLVTLTNSVASVGEAQITNAGLQEYFERCFSADTVQRLKPAPEPYRMVAQALGVKISNVRLIAVHAWDIAGAMAAGCSAAFVARSGFLLDPLFSPPDIIGANMREVASRIITSEVI
jgi:2-haloacid dehalogenase